MTEDTIHPFDAELLQLISDLEGRLHPKTIFYAKDFVKHGEYTVCLEAIISGLESKGSPVPADIFNRIIEYSADVNLKEDAYKGLRSE
ncbi:MafI family immunity protein [Rathayibacter toxicus]|uniref:MafI family immunity protein n=1 Tax=Rathayibacter toxicus TaxID=145458 RepID=UPI000CE8CF63|nr:MafI family immunity protein [Rathayibacter toxicus]PPI52049.1 hypothetical protein C5D35_10780 [Rathayibacter toxicus]QOD11231.1 MafI family immunity protein [Rathayibacter toxicus]QWL27974.1 MafI family immunity protein [Rathayibacter toxicus]QWL31147.1 MafI family immunity protein [Rathayibacter toxicus]